MTSAARTVLSGIDERRHNLMRPASTMRLWRSKGGVDGFGGLEWGLGGLE